jgi:hypothetical protein
MNATLLAIATTLSGIIVFMKNDEKTSRAATHAADRHRAPRFQVDADDVVPSSHRSSVG